MKYGLQMYSVRDITDTDLKGALKKVAQMGYSMVEYAGFFGHTGEELYAVQKENGLICSGTHSGMEGIKQENLAASIAYHKALGCDRYIVPGGDLSTKEKLDAFIADVNAAKPVFEAAGMSLHYHNHSHEFVPNEDGLYIHKELEERTEVLFELDTFWVFNAGLDPIKELERLSHRIEVIHLKDGMRGGEGRALGEGEAPVEAVRAWAIANRKVMVVESEGLNPTGLEEVGRCMDYLKKLDARDGI